MTADIAALRSAIAPHGRLRAAINLGNAVLARRDADGRPQGVTVDLANEVSRRLDLPVELFPFDGAGRVVDGATADVWDIAFLAIDPLRADTIDFTAPYVLIEGAFVVRDTGRFAQPRDLDADGVRITVGEGAAYELYLKRTFKRAELVRYPTSAAALEGFLRDGLDAGAGIRQPVLAFAQRHAGLVVQAEAFMQIRQAMALPKGRPIVLPWIEALLKELKANGFVAKALARSGQSEALVAMEATP